MYMLLTCGPESTLVELDISSLGHACFCAGVCACACVCLPKHHTLLGLLQGSVETIARGHEASVRIAMQGHHAAAAAARLPVATLSQMLKSALSVELDTRQVSQRLMRLIKADRWHMKAEQILRSHAKPTGELVSQTPGILAANAVLQETCLQQGSIVRQRMDKLLVY